MEELNRAVVRAMSLRRSNTAEDIAAMTLLLASDEARNITGQAFNADGGLVVH